MKRKSVLSLILCYLLLAGCAGGNQTETEVTENTTDTAASSETTAPAIAYDYPDKDYEGYEFVFLNQDQCSWQTRSSRPKSRTASSSMTRCSSETAVSAKNSI